MIRDRSSFGFAGDILRVSRRAACYAAAVAGHSDVVDALVRAGAKADAEDDDGRTAFWACCALRHLDVAAKLLDASPGVLDKRDHSGKSPLQHAVEAGHADVIEFLRARGAKDAEARLATTGN